MTTIAIAGLNFLGGSLVNIGTAFAQAAATQAITSIFDDRRFEGPRLNSLHIQTSRDGAPMSRVYGRVRLAGQVIWASKLREVSETSRVSGGKGGGPRQTTYSYSINFAIGLCEGEILGVDRLWANGSPLQTAGLTMRIYKGGEDQAPDPIISATEGTDIPAFRGTAYIVFEDFPLDGYGGRLPQINAEVIRIPKAKMDEPRLETLIRSVNLLPGSGEYAYATEIVEDSPRPGVSRPVNMNNLSGKADIELALDQLQDQLPNCRNVSIISAWYGTDLRCGDCEIRPGVERRDRIVPGNAWKVGQDTRGSAYLISQSGDGRPNYGGTPSDKSLKQAIAALKSRGFQVTLYPFLLMDIPANNTGAAFPWRGRITATIDQTAQTAIEVNSFFDREKGYRNFILHYAQLAQDAGGVDRFIIGSELRGLTTLRDVQNNFPAVTKLAQLAGDIRQLIGPQTGLTYAADWTEYFGYHPQDNSGNVFYHLDELWAHPAISAIGIDAYFPLSDWRDLVDHADADIGNGPYDLEYLKSQIEGGEGYDYFYASEVDRGSQIRSNITDGLAQKDWVYRYKDIRNWWSNSHYNRINNQEVTQPTPWQPESKPIWLLEVGCPAIHNGAHQPNVFFDPKSSESNLPYNSEGYRDDLIQRNYLNALLSYWNDAQLNPNSTVYLGKMIDTDLISIWAWDARPFPDFPARNNVWADGDNWQRGHWLSGRMGLVTLASIIEELCAQCGVVNIDTSGVCGLVQGYHIDRPMSGRAALTSLFDTFNVQLSERAGTLVFSTQGQTKVHEFNPSSFALVEGPVHMRDVDDSNTKLKDVRLHFIDIGNDYQLGSVSARDFSAETVRVLDLRVPIVMDRSFADYAAKLRLKAHHLSLERLSFSLPTQGGMHIHVGDRLRLGGESRTYQVDQIDVGQTHRIRATRIDDSGPIFVAGGTPNVTYDIPWRSRPASFGFDVPGYDDPLVGSVMNPFEPHSISAGDVTAAVKNPLKIGALTTSLPKGPVGRWDRSNVFSFFMPDTLLAGFPEHDILSGKNKFAVETDVGWEVLQIAEIKLTAPSTYQAIRLLRGLHGSDSNMADSVAAGARIVALDSGVAALPLSPDWLEETVSVRPQVPGREGDDSEFLYTGQHLRPFSPVHIRAVRQAEDLRVMWVRRTRIDGDSWAGTDVPLGEAEERYRVAHYDNGTLIETYEVSEPKITLPTSIVGQLRISQLSRLYGWGAEAVFDVS